VFSYAERVDDHASLPSPLIARLPGFAEEIARPVPPARAMFAGSPGVERQPDERAPAWPEGAPLRNGAALIEAQSACPFQAVGHYRLRAEAWPGTYAGLKPTERGKFVHAAFAAFWREVRDQAMLNALGEAALDAQVASAVAAGRTAVDDALWDALPPVVAAVEAGHVGRVMKRWLLDVDRGRPAFCVESTEAAVTLTLAGHPVTLRIDRVDSLATGARAIIDYKTGRAVPARHWFGERPQAPQLGLYAMALGDAANVAALAYAQLKPGQVRPLGLADVAATWPGLLAPSELKGAQVADWQEALRQLREGVVTLAQAVHDGDARVVPRDTKVCTRCDLRPLCRIAAVDEGDDVDDDAEAAA
jgi:RecB family exonuclease